MRQIRVTARRSPIPEFTCLYGRRRVEVNGIGGLVSPSATSFFPASARGFNGAQHEIHKGRC